MGDAANDAGWVLPEGWEELTSRSSGDTYWFNTTTGESTFDRPAVPAADAATDLQLPPGWRLGRSEGGELYYIDTVTGASTYDFPYEPAGADAPAFEEQPRETTEEAKEMQQQHQQHQQHQQQQQQQLQEGPTPRLEGHASNQAQAPARAAESQRPGARADESVAGDLSSDLPAGWASKTSRSTGSVYYVNLVTGESTFERPAAPAAVAPSPRSGSRFALCTGPPRARRTGTPGKARPAKNNRPTRGSTAEQPAAPKSLAATRNSFVSTDAEGRLMTEPGSPAQSIDEGDAVAALPSGWAAAQKPLAVTRNSFVSTDAEGRLMTEPGSPAQSIDEGDAVAALPSGWEVVGDKFINLITGETTTEFPAQAADELDMLDDDLQEGQFTPESNQSGTEAEANAEPRSSQMGQESTEVAEVDPELGSAETGASVGLGGTGTKSKATAELELEPAQEEKLEPEPEPEPEAGPRARAPSGRKSMARAQIVRIIGQQIVSPAPVVSGQQSAGLRTAQSAELVAEKDAIAAEKAALVALKEDALAAEHSALMALEQALAAEEAALLAEQTNSTRTRQNAESHTPVHEPSSAAEPVEEPSVAASATQKVGVAVAPAATKRNDTTKDEVKALPTRGAEKVWADDDIHVAETRQQNAANVEETDGVEVPAAHKEIATSPDRPTRAARLQEMQRLLAVKKKKAQLMPKPAPADALSVVGAHIRAQNISVWTVVEQFVAATNSTAGQLTTSACTAWLLALQLVNLSLSDVHEAYTEAAKFSTGTLLPSLLVALGFEAWTNLKKLQPVSPSPASGMEVLQCLADRMELWKREASSLLDALREDGVVRVDRNSFGIFSLGLGLELAPRQLDAGWEALVPPENRDLGLDVDYFVAELKAVGEQDSSVAELQSLVDSLGDSREDHAATNRGIVSPQRTRGTPVRRARPRTPSPPREKRDKAVDIALDTLCQYLGFNRHDPTGNQNSESKPRYMQTSSSYRHKVAPSSTLHDGKTFAEIHARATLSNLRPGHHTRHVQSPRRTPDDATPVLWDHSVAVDLFQKLRDGGITPVSSPRPAGKGLTAQALHASLTGFFGLTLSEQQAEVLLRKIRGGGGGACSQSEFIATFRQLSETGTPYGTTQTSSSPRRKIKSRVEIFEKLAHPASFTGSHKRSPYKPRLDASGRSPGKAGRRHLSETWQSVGAEDISIGEESAVHEPPWSEASSSLNHSSALSDGDFPVASAWEDDLDSRRAESDLQVMLREEAALAEEIWEREEAIKSPGNDNSDGALERRLDALAARRQDRDGAVEFESGYATPMPAHLVRVQLDAAQRRSTIFDRLADHSSFTGTHKARFDSDGRGLGRSGRMDPHERVAGIETMVDRSRPRMESDSPLYCGGVIASSGGHEDEDERQAIFVKLAEPKHFTGAHRARFDQTGKGRGLSGRLDDHERWLGEDGRLNRGSSTPRAVVATSRSKSPAATKRRARTPQKRAARGQADPPHYMKPISSRTATTTPSSRGRRRPSG